MNPYDNHNNEGEKVLNEFAKTDTRSMIDELYWEILERVVN